MRKVLRKQLSTSKQSYKKHKLIEILAWIPVVAIVVFIFYMSSQDGDASIATSLSVSEKITGKDETYFAMDQLNMVVRDFAHLFEYAVLSFFVGVAVRVNGFTGKIRCIYMVLFGEVITFLDEFYQIFVPLRYGDWQDIFIDSVGVILVAVLSYLIEKSFLKKKSADREISEKLIFMNITIDNISFDQALDKIIDLAADKKCRYLVTPNVDHMVKLQKDKEFFKIYENADLVVADGTPLLWIAESLGHPIREKITGADLLPAVCKAAAQNKLTAFILGAEDGVAEEAANQLQSEYKGLNIIGTYSPEVGFEDDKDEIEKIINLVNEASPDILILSLGSPKQEKFIFEYKDKMCFGIALPIGAAVTFAAGTLKRAPEWMRKAGLEWLFRLFQEPGRMFKRYLIDDMDIFWYAWKYRDVIKNQERRS